MVTRPVNLRGIGVLDSKSFARVLRLRWLWTLVMAGMGKTRRSMGWARNTLHQDLLRSLCGINKNNNRWWSKNFLLAEHLSPWSKSKRHSTQRLRDIRQTQFDSQGSTSWPWMGQKYQLASHINNRPLEPIHWAIHNRTIGAPRAQYEGWDNMGLHLGRILLNNISLQSTVHMGHFGINFKALIWKPWVPLKCMLFS